MGEVIKVERLRAGALFKLIFIGNILFFVAFSALMGILSFFGAATVTWNDQPVTGVAGLISAPFIGVFIALILSAFQWIFMFTGLWLYSKFRNIELEYIPTSES